MGGLSQGGSPRGGRPGELCRARGEAENPGSPVVCILPEGTWKPESTGGKHKACPPPCFIWPGTLFLPGSSSELSLNY